MNLQRVAAVVVIITGLLDLVLRLYTGAWLIFSWVVAVYDFIVTVPFLPPILTLIFGFTAGLYLGVGIGAADSSASSDSSGSDGMPSRISGCLEINDVLWKARADLSDLSVSRLYVESEPYCPECNTVLDEDTAYKTTARPTNIWQCANCEFQTERESNTRNKAERIVERHYRQIATNQDEDYAYGNLVKRIEEDNREVTGESIWREYVATVDDDFLSSACFV